MSYTISKISEIVGGEVHLSNASSHIEELSIDSRRIILAETTLFFAIHGPRNDGHHYLNDLIKYGVKNFVVQLIPEGISLNGLNFILVKNSVDALQKLAIFHRNCFKYPVIGITGSNGKTIVKEWLYQVLSGHLRIVRNPKSYNSQVGVPLSVWQLNNTYDLGIFEAGISMPGEMQHLEKILKPEIGIFTNLGDAHSENFKSIEEKGREKLELFKNATTVLFKLGNKKLDAIFSEWRQKHKDKTFLCWSDSNPNADLFIRFKENASKKNIVASYQGKTFDFELSSYDPATIENVSFVLLTALNLGIDIPQIVHKISHLEAVEMRLQKIEGINNTILINDTYNSDIQSFEISVDFLTRHDPSRSNTVILTDILQTEKTGKELYSMVNKILKAKNINRFIGIGKEIEKHIELIDIDSKEVYRDKSAFLSNFELKSFKNENILLKGARKFGLEEVVQLLEKQKHQTVFEINLTAIEENFRTIKTLLPKGTKVMGMVKAFSYGSGSFEVAKLLQDSGVDYLAVAYTDEGVALRQKGIKAPIMVMNPDHKAFETMLDYGLEPEIYSFNVLTNFIKALESNGKASHGVHIEFDTGMHRLGFKPEDLSTLLLILEKHPKIEIKSVFSHLAGSDENRLKEFTLSQIEALKKIEESFILKEKVKPIFHILNSAGILHYPSGMFDMVRVGIALHGIDPSDKNQKKLNVAGSLKSYISQIKEIKAGQGISYGLHSATSKTRKIAIIAIGYADGLSRKLGCGNWAVQINGEEAPTVGNICMDMFMADVTQIKCYEGDEVIIFGQKSGIEKMAEVVGTIPYEILTSISSRVKRVYWYE